jgi:hypothetical protein
MLAYGFRSEKEPKSIIGVYIFLLLTTRPTYTEKRYAEVGQSLAGRGICLHHSPQVFGELLGSVKNPWFYFVN